ncbi:MAG: hypothetical protein QXQ02_07860, partial [Halobacteria archaeon]
MKGIRVRKLMFVVPHFRGGGVERVISYLESYAPAGFEVLLTSMERPKNFPVKSNVYVIKRYTKPIEFIKSLMEYYRVLR